MLTRSKTNVNTVFHSLPYYGRVLSTYRKYYKQWISASSLYNYMINDPVNDWYSLSKSHNKSLFNELLSAQGIKFEKMVIQDISETYNIQIPMISSTINDKTVKKTLKYMEEGHPVLYSVPLSNSTNKTRGIADLLIRSDWVNRIFEIPYLDSTKQSIGCNFSDNWHYVVIDIKYITLPLTSDGIYLQNTSSIKYAKAQVCLYNEALGKLQGFTPDIAFVLGRRSKYVKKGNQFIGHSCYERLGVVDIANKDSWVRQEVENAIQWQNSCKRNKEKWQLIPKPSVKQLYPNMCNKNSLFQSEKTELANYLNDITQIWNCTSKHRDILLDNGITSILDERCTAGMLGFTGNKRIIIDSILNIQRQNHHTILPEECADIPSYTPNEFFVDFETIPDILTDKLDSPICRRTPYIFLIGVGFMNRQNVWEYRQFTMKKLTLTEELRVLREFLQFVNRKESTLYHWHRAEPQFWNIAMKRHPELQNGLNWYDLSELFLMTPITIKNCMNFSLKNVAKAMFEHNMIQTQWSFDISNGLECAAQAVRQYETIGELQFDNIIRYNEIDCKVIAEILQFLRKKY